ncbi:hypothetical protein GWO43_11400 [candidate division KSB1 bacterium]|nr:hypothetical protein [candidate division KSB1 bacterium]NIR70608.1 hypothetical protein [candidate division KSB1 bacterium]NIS24553.1 hypothetical protein [candidate division KSB1 bacterium]NIT71471.1 hypothetical protein [candidate division KSB1 bacterium]NIU25162.1 hypothetical protein [candidate division KSB1 bacterium]
MSQCQYEALLPEYCSGDLTSPKKDEVARHVETCDACKKLVQELSEVQSVLAERQRPAVSEDLMSEYKRTVEKTVSSKFNAVRRVNRAVQYSRHLLVGKKPWMRFAQVAFLLLVGLLLGKIIYDTQSHEDQVAFTPKVRQLPFSAADLRLVSDFLEESEMILLEIANHDLSEMTQQPDLFLDAKTAQKLLMQTFIIHEHALRMQIKGLSELLTQMELILYDLANSEVSDDRNELLKELRHIISAKRLLDVNRELRSQIAGLQQNRDI